MTIRAVLLDTNHISDLARGSNPAGDDIIRRLQSGNAVLAVSLFEIAELADPRFAAVNDVKALLRDLPVVLANPFEELEEEEMACAVAKASGLVRRPPRPFARDMAEWGCTTGVPGASAHDIIEAFASLPEERRRILNTAQFVAAGSMIKRSAKVIQEPLSLLTVTLQHHLDANRLRFADYGNGKTASDIITEVGGKSAFPGFQVQEALAVERMKDPGQKSTGNDVLDEFIAFHSPYSAVTAVDRKTYHRARMAKLPHVDRMTRRLDGVVPILDRVLSGELKPAEFSW